MAVFKCKMCGANLESGENKSVATCEFCGTQQTLPKIDDEKKLALFNRANNLRLKCEFDKAAGIYESLIAEFLEEAEAYLKTHAVTSACQSWDLGSFKTLLLKENKDYTRLIYNIVSIYSSISTKDSTIPSFLNYISTILRQRSALKSYVNNAFATISSVYERERYSINFDKNLKIYYLEADTSLISISVFTIPPSIMAFPFFISKLFIIYYTPLFQEQVTAKQPLPHKA